MKSFIFNDKKYDLNMFKSYEKELEQYLSDENYNQEFTETKFNDSLLLSVSIKHRGINVDENEFMKIEIDGNLFYLEVSSGFLIYRKGDRFVIRVETFEI